jgi:hypothetical protein
LADNLTLMKQQDGSEVKQLQTVDNDDEDYDIPDSIEEIIGLCNFHLLLVYWFVIDKKSIGLAMMRIIKLVIVNCY